MIPSIVNMKDAFSLKGKNALVTGGNRGLGLAIARMLDYNCSVNTSDRIIHTYMGTLLPHMANATYATAGELSPLLKDPELRTIGIGTRVFFCGAQGYVVWEGTQCFPGYTEYEDGVRSYSGATLALIGDMKKMSTDYIRAARIYKYGVSMFVGVGIPFPFAFDT